MTGIPQHHPSAAPETHDRRREQRLVNEMMELLVTHFGGELSEEVLDQSIDDLQQAISIGRNCHRGQVRKSGEPYFFHPLRVAHLAARHWMDFPSVIAAILHDVVEDTPMTLDEVEAEFGGEVALLVNGLTKVEDKRLSKEDLKAETYRKQLLAAIEDVRVLCLKFWDRIDNMQTIGALKKGKQLRIAEETRAVYVPLAQHLGMGYVATRLDALALNVIYPARAERYRRALESIQERTAPALRKIRARIQNSLEHHKLNSLQRDRWRPFSIAAARLTARGLATTYTLEILVDRVMDAYLVLGLLHSLYPPIPGKLRDHLNAPSHHGYQALKTTVQAAEHRLRVEITTRKFARFNEAGVLAPGFEFQLANFKKLMRSLFEGESAVDTEGLRLASAQIRVYTPQGELRILPEGSSALDFAFDIHENLGLHAWRARINGKTRLLKARLMDGDQIAIERSDTPSVLPKWLEWAVTPKARNAIRRYLRSKVKKNS
ncbi:HD domain-containing protein [Geothermobacter hydrogeniphilus]|uniref:Phosphohydrolase n=1 Tax=Geothermobacter hydrogeniphilus TaxID=1969733 RepID=A0A1X0YEP3_9BACT|nr:HD domain-containing protein [Geothermobacter hydrogeniphilus]ORJ63553.1 phosphohydrolase [Geothermobacter hydrogeniphilus]